MRSTTSSRRNPPTEPAPRRSDRPVFPGFAQERGGFGLPVFLSAAIFPVLIYAYWLDKHAKVVESEMAEKPQPKVLIVEDTPSMAEALRRLSRRLRLCGLHRRDRQGGARGDPPRPAGGGAARHPSAGHQRPRNPQDRARGGDPLGLRGDHRPRLDQRRGGGDAGRRAGLSGQAVHQGPPGGDGAQRGAARLAGAYRRAPEGGLRPRRLLRHSRLLAADAGDLPHHRFGGVVARHGVHHRRIRHRQGTLRRGDSPRQPAPRQTLRRDQLRPPFRAI